MGGLASTARGFFNNTTPHNTNVQVPTDGTTSTGAGAASGGATVITKTTITTTAQQTGCDSHGTTRCLCSSTGANLKFPNKYNN
jgi:hypothetical protein